MEDFPDVDAYLAQAELWPDVVAALRPVLVGAGLDETIKWGKPCYVRGSTNIAIVQEFRDACACMFVKGALLDDPHALLEDVGPNTRSARRAMFTSVAQVEQHADALAALVADAVRVEEAGLAVEPDELVLVAELQERLDADADLRAAFDALTPGRQRAYNLHVGGAKQSATRHRRVDQHVARILAGKGLRDR